MKIWELTQPDTAQYAEFLHARGVDVPREWSVYLYKEGSVCNKAHVKFRAFLIERHPVHYMAWRILTGGK